VLEEGRDENQRRGLRPADAFDGQRGTVGGEVTGDVYHDADTIIRELSPLNYLKRKRPIADMLS
jgi:hypothetical protein